MGSCGDGYRNGQPVQTGGITLTLERISIIEVVSKSWPKIELDGDSRPKTILKWLLSPGYNVGLRRLAREIALRILFQYEASESLTPQETFDLFCRSFSPEGDETEDPDVLGCERGGFKRALPFIQDLFFGVTSHQKELDNMLAEASDNWKLGRMSRVDRNVMRIALYEMLYKEDIPFKVSLNEAVDLGKEFGTEDSGAFINGVLDHIHLQLVPKDSEETS